VRPPAGVPRELCRALGLESHYSTHPRTHYPPATLEPVVHSSSLNYARKIASALLCAAVVLVAGCHNNNNATSGYGIVWTTVTAAPGDFTSYITTISSVTLTRNDGVVATAIGTPEYVDFTQLSDIAELWGSGGVPVGTYLSATISLSYTNSSIYVMVNGQPQKAAVLDYNTNAAPTTYSLTVTFDPQNPLVITSTYASTSAQRLAVNFDLAASNRVSFATNPATVYVNPFITAGVVTADTRPIRVRGPLINSSGDVQTYTVYTRPFYDEANNIGTVTLFNQSDTVWTINGKTYVGPAGLSALSTLSAGTTMTAGWTQFVPDYNPANGAHAGRFNLIYVVGASSLEDQYTEGIGGDVVARRGNVLALQGATLFLNTANTFSYEPTLSTVLLGPGTLVTADDNTTLTGLNDDSIAVGQHITARGIYSVLANGSVQIDATGTSSTNTGSVRLQSTELWGPLVSSTADGLVMNLQNIANWPVSDYNFAGNGAVTPNPTAWSVSTTGLTLPAGTVAPDPVWIDGFFTPFGSAPPETTAVAANNESTVQLAGTPLGGGTAQPPGAGTQTCGVGSQICDPASYRVQWNSPGTTTPFATFSTSGFSLDLKNAALGSAVIRIGPESIDATTLSSPLVVPTTAAATSTFAPQYVYGNPLTSTTTSTVTTATTSLHAYSNYADFATSLEGTIDTSNPATQMEAQGVYDRITNTFTATRIDFVL